MALSWYDVLVQLSEAQDNQLRMHELAHAVLLSRAGLTRMVDRMTVAEFVERIPCPEDRRGMYVHMTSRGRRALDTASPVHLRGIQRHFTRVLDARQLKTLETALDRVVRAASDTTA